MPQRPPSAQGLAAAQRHLVRCKTAWTAAHLRWLSTLKLAHAAQQIGFQEYLHSITEATARIARLEQALHDTLPEWSLRPIVQALQAMRGVQMIAAITLAAELQDFLRFDSPRQLMAYVGLVPGEHSSGPKRRQVTDIAWKAQLRLNAKFRSRKQNTAFEWGKNNSRRCSHLQIDSRCRRGNTAQPLPLGNPRKRYWWALHGLIDKLRMQRDLSPWESTACVLSRCIH